MEILVQSNLLTVGLNGKAGIIGELPVRLVSTVTASEAVSFIRNEKFDLVLSKWGLDDLGEGLFLRRLRMVKPDLRTIVLVDGRDPTQEILARSIGVSVVLNDDCPDEMLTSTIAQILCIEMPASVTNILEQTEAVK